MEFDLRDTEQIQFSVCSRKLRASAKTSLYILKYFKQTQKITLDFRVLVGTEILKKKGNEVFL